MPGVARSNSKGVRLRELASYPTASFHKDTSTAPLLFFCLLLLGSLSIIYLPYDNQADIALAHLSALPLLNERERASQALLPPSSSRPPLISSPRPRTPLSPSSAPVTGRCSVRSRVTPAGSTQSPSIPRARSPFLLATTEQCGCGTSCGARLLAQLRFTRVSLSGACGPGSRRRTY